MKYPVGILLPIFFCILACGCMGQAPAIQGPFNVNGTPIATHAVPISPQAIPVIATLSDSRAEANLTLPAGVIIVSFHTVGPADILAWFTTLSNTGYGALNGFSTKESYNGSIAFQVPETGQYLLNITGRGTWTAEVSQLHAGEPQKPPLNLSGAGTMVTPVFYLEKGGYLFERNETLLASPLYLISHINGSPLMDPNNSFIEPGFGQGSPEPFRIIRIPEDGVFYLCAVSWENPNSWSVSISPVPKIPFMGPGPVINGSTGNTTL